jgi:hypothetical protein
MTAITKKTTTKTGQTDTKDQKKLSRAGEWMRKHPIHMIINYIKKDHLLTFAGLAPVKEHNDPFDRMIIAQAITEKIPLISSDTKMKYYRKQSLDFIPNENPPNSPTSTSPSLFI